MPGTADQCQWMGVIESATHLNLAENRPRVDHIEPLVTKTVTTFLAGVRAQACVLPEPTDEMILQVK
jgi:hypothetical protein